MSFVDFELERVLRFCIVLLTKAKPRRISIDEDIRCNIIMTDAAVDEDGNLKGSIGGVLFSHRLSQPEYFSAEIPDDVMKLWSSRGSLNVIGQAEILPVTVAKAIWQSELKGARNLFFIDNESARECLIRCFSPNEFSRQLILRSVAYDAEIGGLNWYSRVPTRANWSDGPSRLKSEEFVKAFGAKKREVPKLSVAFFSDFKPESMFD